MTDVRTDEERILTQVARQKALELEALGGTARREWAERVAFALAAKSGTDRISHLKFEIEQLDRTIAITNRLQHDRRIARSLLAASLITTVAAVLVGNLGVAVVGLCFAPAIGASLYLIDMPRYDRPSIDSGHLR